MNYAIVDIETTGGSTKSSKITEIAIYKHNGAQIIDSFSTLVNPEMPIPDFIARLTGIHDKMVEGAPKFYEIAKQIIEFTEDCIFVAHNVGFDYGIIRHEFKLLGYDYRKAHLCTVRASRYVLPGHESYSLGKLSRALGIELTNRHRAIGDAEATAHLFTRLFETDSKGLETFIQEDVNPKILNPNLDLEILEEIPNKPGVYRFYNDTNQLIYIGKSKHIRKRVEQHLKNVKTLKGSVMRQEIARIEFELTGSELIALLYESELIKIHKPLYNRALRKNTYAYGLFHFEDQRGYLQLYVDKISKSSSVPLTTFTTKKEATDYIFMLAETHQLCQKLSGVEKSSSSCFGYQVKKCHGACVGAETPESYNERVLQLINLLTFDDDSFFIVENGKDKREKSVIWIENGSFRGFGYIPYYTFKQPHRNWLRYIDLHPEDKDARTILRYYLRKNPELSKIPFRG
ncbi:exonuclease domain-containing protein [Fluviicola sp.]|uniref:exonuclease domain-containing protein n=1 Tax=Fluviicola sp. TaxID=1917219 RepID=UPI0031CE204C